jgi:hypothetical protein
MCNFCMKLHYVVPPTLAPTVIAVALLWGVTFQKGLLGAELKIANERQTSYPLHSTEREREICSLTGHLCMAAFS